MFVVTKDVEARNFKLAAGMPLPVKYSGKYSRDSIERTYGKGCIMEVSHRNIDDFKMLLADLTGDEKIKQLTVLCEEQAKKIQALESENAQLKRRTSKPAKAETVAQPQG